MESPLIMRLMASSVKIASEAGSIIRKVFSGGKLGIVDKGVNDLQTQADRSAQHCIVSSLSHKFPGLCIIGEEDLGGESQPFASLVEELDEEVLSKSCPPSLVSTALEDLVVWVDPLDGTAEFAQGLIEHVTVLVGISVKGRAVGGVVCQPFHMADCKTFVQTQQDRHPELKDTTQRVIWGLEGLGVFGMKHELLSAAPVFNSKGDQSLGNVIVSTRSHSRKDVLAAIEACLPSKVLKVGGCGFKILLLLEGCAHSYVYASTGCKRWDTCAPEALLNSSGGRLTGFDGKPYIYSKDVNPLNKFGVLATPSADWHNAYLARIPKEIQESLSNL